MTVRFKCHSEYQKSYRSRSVSPQRCAPFAGIRSDHMGISREPCLQRRKKFISPDSRSFVEPIPDALTSEAPAAPKKQPLQQAEPEPPPGPRPARDPSGEPIAAEKSATSTPLSVKPHPNKPESHPQSSRHAPTVPDQQKPATSEHALRWRAGLRSAGQRSEMHKTEYNRQFGLKKPPPAPSPILTAHQNVKKKREMSKNKPHPKSEAPVQGKEGNRSHSILKASPPNHVPSNSPAQRRHRMLTEYEIRYCSPFNKIPEEDEAMVSHTPQIKELREQALAYRHRAWGTNFSRDHLSQLLSEHNALWEPTETTDSATDCSPRLDLCQVSTADPDSCSASCVEALDLASHSSQSSHRTSVAGSRDGEVNQSNKNTKTNAQKSQSPPAECQLDSIKEDEESNEEEEGRLPTPKLKMLPVQRTHHDLTTPATGGAILVGTLKSPDEPSPHNQRCGTADSVMVNAETRIPAKPKEAWSEDSPRHNCLKPASSPQSKPIMCEQTPPASTVLPPTVPQHCIQGTLRHADFQHNGELGLRFKERQCTGGYCGSDEDDRLSVMSWRSAASCSMASAVLERAQKRRENFWGKK